MSPTFAPTPEQIRAIECRRRGQILVSAAAGSGKTAVLAERILRLCLERGTPPEALAVMTFTEKAALNMKRRLERLLEGRIAAAGGDTEAVRAALDLKERLPLAQISTIHAFCLRLIRDYQAELRDDQGEPLLGRRFSVLDSEEARRLLEEAISDCLAEVYSAIADKEAGHVPEQPLYPTLLPREGGAWLEDLQALFALHDQNLSDESFRQELTARHAFLRALPDYPAWCAEALRNYAAAAESPEDEPSILDALVELERLRRRTAAARRSWEEEPYFAVITAPPTAKDSKELQAFRDYYPAFSAFLSEPPAASADTAAGGRRSAEELSAAWEKAKALGESLASWPVLRKGKDEKQAFREAFYPAAGPLLQLLSGTFADKAPGKEFGVEAVPSPFFLDLEEISRGSRAMLPVIARFLELILAIDRCYAEKKRRREAVDYADFEHLAYRLLSDPLVREEIAQRYQEILVDEYQDTSPLQEALLLRLGSSVYTMLGDIKQSIYRFRHAAPDIFARKLAAFRDDPEESGDRSGTRLFLNRNFRSRAAVLERINRIFRSFLTTESGEILYDEDQALIPGKDESGMRNRGPAFAIRYFHSEKEELDPETDDASAEAEEEPDGEETEVPPAAFLSESAEASAHTLPVLDAVLELRDRGFAYGEIAVLCRTNGLCSDCLAMLEVAGIPAVVGSSAKNLDSPELRLLEHLAALLDNVRQDYPLAAVLRSPLLGEPFREEALLRVAQEARLPEPCGDGENSFSARFFRYAEHGSDDRLRIRCRSFLEEIQAWRSKASCLSLAELFRSIVEKHGWLEKLAEQPYGSQRLRDVESFLDWAAAADGSNLADFASAMSRVRAQKLQIKGRDRAPESDRAVRIMTLHAAKGLEFPAVIYPKCGAKRQGGRESKTLIRFSVREGLAALLPAPEGRLVPPRYTRFQKAEAFAERAEAFRLLYVCLTRAEEAVILCASGGKKEECRLKKDLRRTAEAAPEERALALAAASSDASLIVGSLRDELPALPLADETGEALGALSLERLGSEEEAFRPFFLKSQDLEFSGRSLETLRASLGARLERQKEEDEREEALSVRRGGELQPESAETLLLYPEADEAGREALKTALYAKIAGQELNRFPSKLTVSELKQQALSESRRTEGLDPAAAAGEGPGETPFYPKALREMLLQLRSPESAESEETLSPTAYGSFLHRLFQDLPVTDFVDLAEGPLPEDERERLWQHFIEEERRLCAISPEEAETARPVWPYYRSFLDAELGRRLIHAERQGAVVRRELPFTLALPAEGLPQLGLPGEREAISLLQGMIDLFFVEGEEAVLIDYKSDRIPGSQDEADAELRRRYQLQLAAYAEAIRRINGRRVKEALIWLIREGRAVPIPL